MGLFTLYQPEIGTGSLDVGVFVVYGLQNGIGYRPALGASTGKLPFYGTGSRRSLDRYTRGVNPSWPLLGFGDPRNESHGVGSSLFSFGFGTCNLTIQMRFPSSKLADAEGSSKDCTILIYW